MKFIREYLHFSRWPFNEKTPLGFLCQSFFGGIEWFTLMIIVLSGLSFLYGSCWLFVAFVDDIKCDLNECASESNSSKVKQHLCDIVKAFSDVKGLSI